MIYLTCTVCKLCITTVVRRRGRGVKKKIKDNRLYRVHELNIETLSPASKKKKKNWQIRHCGSLHAPRFRPWGKKNRTAYIRGSNTGIDCFSHTGRRTGFLLYTEMSISVISPMGPVRLRDKCQGFYWDRNATKKSSAKRLYWIKIKFRDWRYKSRVEDIVPLTPI